MTLQDRLNLLNSVFTPTSPIKDKDFFQGRIQQLEKICEAINEVGQHAILYGDRGVGKTSLANIMPYSFTNLFPIKVTCNRGDSFKTIWKKALSEIKFSTTTQGIGFKPDQKNFQLNLLDNIDPNSDTFSNDIESLLRSLGNDYFLFIFDEFDNVLDQQMRKAFADLIKSFSDNISNVTIVLVGIAHNVESLIGSHQSLERCLKQIQMPRMSENESSDIIENGLRRLGITINSDVKQQIVEFSSGFPHYIHLLCKYGAQNVIYEERNTFEIEDLKKAIDKGIENTSEQLKSAYRNAITGLSTTDKWKHVLFAAAMVDLDEFNSFSLNNVAEEYFKLTLSTIKNTSLKYNLDQLCETNRGPVLEKVDTGVNSRYRFINPMIRAFIKLKISSENIEFKPIPRPNMPMFNNSNSSSEEK
jgi:GTPase SAR1 family protein